MKKSFALLPIALLMGCGIGMKVTTIRQMPTIAAHEAFAVIEENEPFDTVRYSLVAKLRTTEKGMTVRCDYPAVLDTVTRLARSLGANLVKIDRHLLPSTYSTCHRVEARLYRADDATPFEQTITWHPERRLRLVDFRGDTAERPFRAASYCGITYHGNYVGRKVSVVVDAFFDHELSYFKRGPDDASVLGHEQLHFDIAELYARTLRRRIMEASFSGGDFNTTLQTLLTTAIRELAIEQDRYDADVYAKPGRQPFWTETVATRLAELDAYRSHTIALSSK